MTLLQYFWKLKGFLTTELTYRASFFSGWTLVLQLCPASVSAAQEPAPLAVPLDHAVKGLRVCAQGTWLPCAQPLAVHVPLRHVG